MGIFPTFQFRLYIMMEVSTRISLMSAGRKGHRYQMKVMRRNVRLLEMNFSENHDSY